MICLSKKKTITIFISIVLVSLFSIKIPMEYPISSLPTTFDTDSFPAVGLFRFEIPMGSIYSLLESYKYTS